MPPSLLIYASTRNYTVQVRMVRQCRTPSMEQCRHASCKVFVAEEGLQCGPGRLEHAAVKHGLVVHGDSVETGRNSKDHMKIFHPGYDLLFPVLSPLQSLLVLTFWTVTVTAAVVTDKQLPAFRTEVNMHSECGGTTLCHVRKGTAHYRRRVMLGTVVRSPAAYDIADVTFLYHYFGGNMSSTKSTLPFGSIFTTWRYISVVDRCLCPIRSFTLMMLSPCSRRWHA